MEPEPSPGTQTLGCPLIQKIARDICNKEKQTRNENRKRTRVERRTRRKRKQVLKEVEETIQETKEALKEYGAAKNKERTTQPRRSPRLNPSETERRANVSMSLRANMHSTRTVTDLRQEIPRQPYEPLPDMQLPRMFPPIALAAFNLRAMHLHEDARYTPQSEGMGQKKSLPTEMRT